VAVLTYLRCIIESVDHDDLLHVILQYLLVLPEKREEETAPVRPTTLARRRKSSMLVTNLAQGQEKPMPDLFTLVDLVLTSLRSRNQQTITATLRLVAVILGNQHHYAVLSFIKVRILEQALPACTIGVHTSNTEALFSMAEDIMDHDDLADAYEAHLQDARTLLESHCCSSRLLALPGPKAGKLSMHEQKRERTRIAQLHVIDSDDPLLGLLVSLLGDFLTNDIDTNLSLTQTFATLASCGNTRLENWLLRDSMHRRDPLILSEASDDTSEHDDTVTLKNAGSLESEVAPAVVLEARRRDNDAPRGINSATSPVLDTLDSLVHQIERFRHEIQEFDTYLTERRHIFRVGEDIEKAVANDVIAVPKSEERNPRGPTRGSKSRTRTVGQIGSISERLMSETSSSEVSRSSSPRGRQPSDSSSTTLVSRINHLRISPSPSPSHSAPRTISPSPLRKGSPAYMDPRQSGKPKGSLDVLRQRVKVKLKLNSDLMNGRDIGSETSSIRSESTAAEAKKTEAEIKEITLSHLLTNVIILQEFILELAAIIEVRASLFGEVRFV